MVIEMFQHFLKAIRDYHAEVVFGSMETIMTLIIEESEEISPDILKPILSTLKKNETALPVAKKLAERVIRSSADKLRPYLPQVLKALHVNFEDYSEVVASVCQDSNKNILKEQLVIKDSTEETSPQDMHTSAKSTVTNGANETGTEETVPDANLVSKTEPGDLGDEEPAKLEAKVDQVAKENARQVNSENAESPDAVDSKKQSEQVNTAEDIPTSPKEVLPPVETANTSLGHINGTSTQLSLSSEHENEGVNVSTPVQGGSLPERKQVKKSARTKRKGKSAKKQQRSGKKQPAKKAIKKDITLIEEDESKTDGYESDSETNSLHQTETLKVSDDENINISSAKKQWGSGKRQHVKKAEKESTLIECSKSKKDGGNESDSETKSLDQTEKLNVSDEENIHVAKMQKGSGKKQPAKKAKTGSTLIEEGESKNYGGNVSDSETEKLKVSDEENISVSKKKQTWSGKKQSLKKAKKGITLIEENESENDGGSDSERHDDSPLRKVWKKSGLKPRSEKDGSKSSVREDDGEDMVTSPSSPLKSTKDGSNKEESPRLSSKRMRTPGTEKASGTTEYGENLVGSKIKVWWPKDRAFYEGVVRSFDSVKKKHAVLYADGDQENLNLKREMGNLSEMTQFQMQAKLLNIQVMMLPLT